MSPSLKNFLITGLLSLTASAHTWNEQLAVIGSNGEFVGPYGYPRGYVARTEPTFNGFSMLWLLPTPASGRLFIDDSDLLCHPAQRTKNQTAGYPRLQVAPGTPIAMKYLENGHVTLPQIVPGKPPKGGTVYLFGTTSPKVDEKLTEVLRWNKNGTGGDGRGRLLAANNFDDNRCHQINDGPISLKRQQEFPDPFPGQPGTKNELWCETNVVMPNNLKPGELLTVYWVWQWPTAPGTPDVPYGKDQYYTTCSDFDVVAKAPTGPVSNTLVQQDPEMHAVSTYLHRTAITPIPKIHAAWLTNSAHPSASTPAPAQPSEPSTSQPVATPQFVHPSEVHHSSSAAAGTVMTALVTVTATMPPGRTALVVQGSHVVTFYNPAATAAPAKRAVEGRAQGFEAENEPFRPVIMTTTNQSAEPSTY